MPNKLKWYDSPRWVFAIVFVLFLIYVLPYLIKGGDVWINQFDNLDQISYLGIFDGGFHGKFFPTDDMPENYLPGMEPIFRVSILSVQKLFWQFGFLPGYIINEMVYRILGFIGFFLLLRRFFMRDVPRILPALLAIAYIYLPFWPQGGLSIAGLPLLAWAFLSIWNKEHLIISYLCVVLYTLYSGFFLTGIFILMILGFIMIALAIARKPFWRLIPPMLIMLTIYCVVYYSFFVILFFEKIPSNRSEILLASKNLGTVMTDFFLSFFVQSQQHAHSFHQYLFLPIIVIGSYVMLRKKDAPNRRLVIILESFIFFCAVIFAIYRYEPINNLYMRMKFGFDYSRFYFLTPPVWYLLVGIVLSYAIQRSKWKKPVMILVTTVLLIQIGINYSFSSLKAWRQKPTFNEVMSTDQFDRIGQFLEDNEPEFDKTTTRIGCFCFAPSVANFNGYRTLGAYCPSYPLHLKNDFVEILQGEMRQNKVLEIYMKKWGSQLYLFDDRVFIHMLDQNWLRKTLPSTTCELNLKKLREMGVDYLFSALPIRNADRIGLTPIARDKGDYYHIYVYRLPEITDRNGD